MINSLGLLRRRRFAPLFATQFLGAFNDNLFKQAMVLFATYHIFHDPRAEENFSSLATGLSILPFFLFSALAGQLADTHDKAQMIRLVKTAEIGIMVFGAAGLMIAEAGHSHTGLVLMCIAIFLLGIHSTFFGPIKYAILPQHLHADEVLGGTGLIEAATYLAILLGTLGAGFADVRETAAAVIVVAGIGWWLGQAVPAAPRVGPRLAINYNPFTASWRLITGTMHIPRLYLAICAISFFWTIGIVLIVVFPPLAKNVLTADKEVASIMVATFSIGIAIGSIIINALLDGKISAKYAPGSVIAMGLAVVAFSLVSRAWPGAPEGHLYDWAEFLHQPQALLVLLVLLLIAVFGGMFVVPLYAFLTTTVEKDQTARTVAANNVVNSGAMVVGAMAVSALSWAGVRSQDILFLVAAMCIFAAWLAQKLHRACD